MFTKSLNISSAAETAMKERDNSVVMDFILVGDDGIHLYMLL